MSTYPIEGTAGSVESAPAVAKKATAEPVNSVTEGDRQPGRQLHAVPDPDLGSSAEVRTAAHTRGEVNPAVNPIVNLDPATDSENRVDSAGDAGTVPVADGAVSETVDAAETVGEDAPEAVVEPGENSPRFPLLAGLAEWVRPPSVTAEAPPSWEQIGWRARYGDQVAVEGWTRTVAVGFAFAATWPGQAVAVYLAWVSRTPSRLAVAIALYTVLVFAHLPYLGWLPFPLKGDL